MFLCYYAETSPPHCNPSHKRDPAWTDRILFASHADLPEEPDKTCVDILLYTTIPSYTTSDHVSDSYSTKSLSQTESRTETCCLSFAITSAHLYNSPCTANDSSSVNLFPHSRSIGTSQTLHGSHNRSNTRLCLVVCELVGRRLNRNRHFQYNDRYRVVHLVESPYLLEVHYYFYTPCPRMSLYH